MPINTLVFNTPETQVQVSKVKAIRLDVRAMPGQARSLRVIYGYFDDGDNLIDTVMFSASGAELPDNLMNDLVTFVNKITIMLQNRGDLPAGSIS